MVPKISGYNQAGSIHTEMDFDDDQHYNPHQLINMPYAYRF